MGQCRLASAKGRPGARASTLADVKAGDRGFFPVDAEVYCAEWGEGVIQSQRLSYPGLEA
jgi:hypothetical protein